MAALSGSSAATWKSQSSQIDDLNEQSPLLEARRSDDDDDDVDDDRLEALSANASDEWALHDEQTRSPWYLFLLTIGAMGLQIAWSVETSNGSPYLLSLGLSKSVLALVWIAGPLSGVLVQPYVGIKSDRCRSKWGKRRPFIVGGCLATVISLMALAWTSELVGGFLSVFGADRESRGVRVCIMLFAVVFVYVLDFAINVLQAAIRAFMVDCAPTHQQDSANAWASRTAGIGNILGYLCGFVNLPKALPFLGNTQFKVLCALATFMLVLTSGISAVSIKERDPNLDGKSLDQQEGIVALFKTLYHAVRRLPLQIIKVCKVQFAYWMGWFPFLFYITTYMGQIYTEPFFEENPDRTPQEVQELWDKGTRAGTFALFIFAITTFASSVLLPFIIEPIFEAPVAPPRAPLTPLTPSRSGLVSFPRRNDDFGPEVGPRSTDSLLSRVSSRTNTLLASLRIKNLTLRRLWLISQLLFSLAMFSTFFIRSVTAATILVSFIGIPWAVSGWAPFALISAEISKRDSIRRGIIRPPPTRDAQLLASGEDESAGADQAGVVLGIHNVAIAAPQVIATLVSSGIFTALQKPRGTPGDYSVAWTLRFGGICGIWAAWLTMGVGEEKKDMETEDG